MRVQTPMARRWQKGDVVDDRQTHPLNFMDFDDEYGPFTIDVAASPANTKCPRFYTSEDDGLAHSWAGETVWCNPPYSDIAPWIRKAWAEHVDADVVMLLPATRTEQGWWQSMVEPFRDRPGSPLEVKFLPGRMHFLRPGQTSTHRGERPPFGCVLLIWCSAGSDGSHVYQPDVVTGGLFG